VPHNAAVASGSPVPSPPPVRRPPGRYDEPTSPGRRVAVAFGLGFAVLVTMLAVKVYRQYGVGEVQLQVRGFRVESDALVRVQFEVGKDPARAADCRLQARGRDGGVTGSAVVRVDPRADGGRTTRVDYPLPTGSRASTGEVLGCRLVPGRP